MKRKISHFWSPKESSYGLGEKGGREKKKKKKKKKKRPRKVWILVLDAMMYGNHVFVWKLVFCMEVFVWRLVVPFLGFR